MSQASIMYQRHQAYNKGTSKTKLALGGQMPSGQGSVLWCRNWKWRQGGRRPEQNLHLISLRWRAVMPRFWSSVAWLPYLHPSDFLPFLIAKFFYFLHIVWIRKKPEGLSAESRVYGELELLLCQLSHQNSSLSPHPPHTCDNLI